MNRNTMLAAEILSLIAMVCVIKLSDRFRVIAFVIEVAAVGVVAVAGYRWLHEPADRDRR